MKKNRIFVVSCQALENESLYGEGIMLKMAKAALIGGADWIRTSQIENIKDIKNNLDAQVIGIIKNKYKNSDVFITSTKKELNMLINSNVDIVAMDATLRKRPKESLEDLVIHFKNYKKLGQKLMADCSSLEDAKNADNLGFDMIATTLYGHTKQSFNKEHTPYNDFKIIKDIKKITDKMIVAEGGIETPAQAKRAYECGADIVVVGSAITRPNFIVQRFVKKINEGK